MNTSALVWDREKKSEEKQRREYPVTLVLVTQACKRHNKNIHKYPSLPHLLTVSLSCTPIRV